MTRSRLREAFGVVALFTALTLGMTWPLGLHLGESLPNDLGDPLLNAWILAWDADRMLDGFRGVWQAPIFHPYPSALAYSEHLLGIAVLVAPVQWAFDNLVLTYNIAFLLSYVLAGGGMYLLVRSLTGHRWAGVLAGMAFAFCPYRVPQITHLQVLMSGWMPIGLWGLHRYHVTGRRTALAAFAVAFVLQGLSNGYYLFFFCVPVAVVAIYSLVDARQSRRRVLLDLSVSAAAILAVVAPVAAVYYQVRQGQGLVRDLGEVRFYSADLIAYTQIGKASLVWGRWLTEGRAEGELFPGLITVLLAGVAVGAAAWQRRTRRASPESVSLAGWRTLIWLYAGIAGLAVLLSLGPNPRLWGVSLLPTSPYAWAMAIVPGLDGLRVPARLAMVVYLALAVLVGLGVAHMFPRLSPRVRAGLGVTLAGLMLLEGSRGATPLEALPREARSFDTAIYRWLADHPPGAVLELPLEGRHRNLDTYHTLLFQYRTLEHGHPLVNGFSGYSTPLLAFLPVAPVWDRTVTADLLAGLRRIGVRYVIVHEALYVDRNLGRATVDALSAQTDQVAQVVPLGMTSLFELRDVTWPQVLAPIDGDRNSSVIGLREVPPSVFTTTASDAGADLPLAFDGDLDTRWSSGRPQDGTEWIELHFDQPRAIARLRLELSGRSWGDYARRLRIESSEDGETFDRVLFDAGTLPLVIEAIPRGRGTAPVEIDVPANRSRALRLRQLGATEAWLWSLDEVRLWERGP